ncbi:MAG TPA: 30S ribosomal protein S15 [Gammaproteobacteria bacterium]|nr:30S ribosomal protein S15 [Gammaproteobacteria bacterium]
MALTTETKAELVNKYKQGANDTGSVEVQVALLSAHITSLTEHLKKHKKDVHSKRGLVGMVNRRRKLLTYLKGKDEPKYQALIDAVGIRK